VRSIDRSRQRVSLDKQEFGPQSLVKTGSRAAPDHSNDLVDRRHRPARLKRELIELMAVADKKNSRSKKKSRFAGPHRHTRTTQPIDRIGTESLFTDAV